MDELPSPATPLRESTISRRLIAISALSVAIGLAGGLVAKALLSLIGLISNLVFFGRISTELVPLSTEHVGLFVVVIPVLGALIIGAMARYGSPAIRGHGIPEVMERVLYGGSRIPAKLMVLKPLSAAIAIGTGGPFGAEGPIIATGGALGSVIGRLFQITADERKVLLSAGAAAGMSATFGTPVSAVLLSIELLLFEYRARSIIPVALAASAAMGIRLLIIDGGAVFPMSAIAEPHWAALISYVVLGALVGLAAVAVTKVVYKIEDAFERLPVHWMWWPAIGAVVVGVAGFIEPRSLGVGYDEIVNLLSGELVGWSLVALLIFKFLSWSVYLGSGTSGGTLAPLFILGGGLGALVGSIAVSVAPWLGISVPVAALVGMAAMFAGASHALLTSIVFAFEATRQPLGLLPLLAGCSAAYMVSVLMMRTSIMTERLARRGAPIRTEYAVDHLSQVLVADAMTREVITISVTDDVGYVRSRLNYHGGAMTHQGFPVVDASRRLVGVVTRRDLLDPAVAPSAKIGELLKRAPAVTHPHNTVREAADHMVRAKVGRLPVVEVGSLVVVGIITRSDLLAAHEPRLKAGQERGAAWKPSPWW